LTLTVVGDAFSFEVVAIFLPSLVLLDASNEIGWAAIKQIVSSANADRRLRLCVRTGVRRLNACM
jgi:hypothetical protein